MTLDRLIDAHRKVVRTARRDRDILDATIDAVRELGFERVALVQDPWFLHQEQRYFCLDNYGEWRDIFIARHYHRHDPVHRAARRMNRCFAWSELAEILGASRVHRPILNEAARHGLKSGLTIPIGVIGEPAGCGSLVTAAPTLPPLDHCRAAAWIVDEALAEVRRVHHYPGPVAASAPLLSPRRLECLRLVAIGHSDVEIAAQLGIALPTVRTHLSALRYRYGVHSRIQLARLAQRFGLVGTDDIIT